MSIRSYLIIFYLALILLLILGQLVLADFLLQKLITSNLKIAETAVIDVSVANYEMSKKRLTDYSERIVEARAEEVAKQLSFILRRQQSFDYAQLRQDEMLREIATQDIYSDDLVVGYVQVYDNKGESVWHPNKDIEGKNFSEWQEQFPEMFQCIKNSFKNKKIKSYCTFFDRKNRKREKFIVLTQVPKTPFNVAAVVNTDSFFFPAFQEMKTAIEATSAATKKSLTQAFQSVNQQVNIISLVFGAFFFLAGSLAALLIAAKITRPLSRLQQLVGQMGEGNLAVSMPATGTKEVAELARSFNRLGQKLTEYIDKRDFIRDTFGRYVTNEVATRLLESSDGLDLGGEDRELSILMSDIRGFTALTADMAPQQVIVFLNRYLSKMIEVLLDHRAVIDEIIGDGILAFFGAPAPMPDHPLQAVACALKMQAAMAEINALNEGDGFPLLEMGVAVNTGRVLVGNIGSEKRTKYGLVGSQVNFTGRIESYTFGGQVLISASTFSHVRDFVDVRHDLKVQMKGVPGEVTLYDVRGISGPFNLKLAEKVEEAVPLVDVIQAQLFHIRHKTVQAAPEPCFITQLSETTAVLSFNGAIRQYENVRLQFGLPQAGDASGKIYGKVVIVTAGPDGSSEATVRFTSISPEIRHLVSDLIKSRKSVETLTS